LNSFSENELVESNSPKRAPAEKWSWTRQNVCRKAAKKNKNIQEPVATVFLRSA